MGNHRSWNPDLRGSDYRPFIDVRAFPSRGKSSRIAGNTTGRVHHLFSTVELNAFYLYDWLEDVVDIREQFALELNDTQAIAAELGIPHIADKQSGEPYIVTSDFVLTRRHLCEEIQLVRSCKRSPDLASTGTLQKLEVERQYWLRRGIDWKLVTERDLPQPLIGNLEWVFPYFAADSVPVAADQLQLLLANLHSHLSTTQRPLAHCCTELDSSTGFQPGTHLALAKHAIATRKWSVDLRLPINGSGAIAFIPENSDDRRPV